MELKRGVIKAFDAVQYTATVQVAGSLSVWLSGVPVAKYLSAELLAVGARCGIVFFDEANPNDASVVFVYEGAPGEWVSDGMVVAGIAGTKVMAATTADRGTVELATDGEVGAGLAVQGNDSRLADARTPLEHDHTKHTNRTRHIWLNPADFEIANGAPSLVTIGDPSQWQLKAKAWALDDVSNESIGSIFELPHDWSGGAFTIKIFWAADTATSGNCFWRAMFTSIGDGDSINRAYDAYLDTIAAAPATAKTRKTSSLGSSSTNLGAGKTILLTITRRGGDGNDTMTGDAILLGVEIEYTADM